MIPSLTDEMCLVVKLKALGIKCNAFDGLTTHEQRREFIRAALLPVDDVTYTVQNGKRITMGVEFARIYGEAP